ncbi:hypothetical protein OIU76_013551 [Salix suchowensis]|nr:hypothetical protein OIU76_013551 [Salix suchowensis]
MLTIDFFASTGNFEQFGHEESTVTCSAMICDYEIQGDGRGSLSIFGDTLKAELKPNEEARGSLGRHSENASSSRWALVCFGAFLHGCGLYSRFDLGNVAIKRMLELQTGESLLLCANLYASDGRWN